MLLATCCTVPYRLAFEEGNDTVYKWVVVNALIDFSFLIDIFVNFFSAYYDDEYVLIDNRRVTFYYFISIANCFFIFKIMVHYRLCFNYTF